MIGVRHSTLKFFGLATILAACMMASPECSPQPAAGAEDLGAIKNVPHIHQKPDFRGEVCQERSGPGFAVSATLSEGMGTMGPHLEGITAPAIQPNQGGCGQ